MKTAVTDTSIECYHAIRGEGKLGKQQAVIMGAMRNGQDYSLQEIVKITGLAINTVSGRCNELREIKALELAEQRRCSVTGRMVRPVQLPVALQ